MSERLSREHAHRQCGKHRVARTADVADFRGIRGKVPSGSESLGTDQSVAAEGDDDVAAVSVGQIPSQSQRPRILTGRGFRGVRLEVGSVQVLEVTGMPCTDCAGNN